MGVVGRVLSAVEGGVKERGSQVVSNLLMTAFLVLVFASLMQLTLAVYVRNMAIDAAGEGARVAALIGGNDDLGQVRAREVLAAAVAPGVINEVQVWREPAVQYLGAQWSQSQVVVVQLKVRLPVIALYGPAKALTVTGRALAEKPL